MENEWRSLGSILDEMIVQKWIECEDKAFPNIMMPDDIFSSFIAKHSMIDGPYPIKLEPRHFAYRWRVQGGQ